MTLYIRLDMISHDCTCPAIQSLTCSLNQSIHDQWLATVVLTLHVVCYYINIDCHYIVVSTTIMIIYHGWLVFWIDAIIALYYIVLHSITRTRTRTSYDSLYDSYTLQLDPVTRYYNIVRIQPDCDCRVGIYVEYVHPSDQAIHVYAYNVYNVHQLYWSACAIWSISSTWLYTHLTCTSGQWSSYNSYNCANIYDQSCQVSNQKYNQRYKFE